MQGLVFCLIILAFPIPIVLALMLNEVRSEIYKRSIQSIIYLPHFISWVIIVGICGDQNGDGIVDVLDATIDSQIAAGLVEPNSIQLVLSDLNRDGEITAADVTLTLQHIVGKRPITGCGPR